MSFLFLDLETYCEVPLKNGTDIYAESVEITVCAYALDDYPVAVLDLANNEVDRSVFEELMAQAMRGEFDKVVAHNSRFDRICLKRNGYDIPVEYWHDTMVRALCHGLPGSLDKLSDIFQLGDKAKDKEGKALIQLFCKPRPKKQKLRRATRDTHPMEWQNFLDYAEFDIVSMRVLYNRLPQWNYRGAELRLWQLDQRINDRGVRVDVELAQAAIASVKTAQHSLAEETSELTYGYVESATKRNKLLKFINSYWSLDLPDLKADTIEKLLKEELPWDLRDLLVARLQASTTSVTKYNRVLSGVSSDGYLRGLIQFSGAARTARDAGRLFQPQNLMRPTLKQWQIEEGIGAMKAGIADMMYDNVMEIAANAMRGVLIADEGKKLVVADLANIEGRFAAWIAGEEWKLEAFRLFDLGLGEDLYKIAYARMFNEDAKSVGKGIKRQIGKVCLAKGTLVMVEAGWLPIEEVTAEHKVWDGVEWVRHQGLQDNGVELVVNVAGTKLTPEHLVLTNGTWTQARQLVTEESIRSLALATGSANLPWSHYAAKGGGLVSSIWWRCNALVGGNPTSCLITTFVKGSVNVAASALRSSFIKRGIGNTPRQCPTTITAPAFCNVLPPLSIGASPLGMQGGLTMVLAGYGSAIDGLKTVLPFSLMSNSFRDGMTQALNLTASMLTAIMKRETSVSSQKGRTLTTGEALLRCSANSTACGKKSQVYDLRNAGPRHRFTVLTSQGPIIVHNCELMLQYEGGVGAFNTGAATYGIDLDAMAEGAYDLLPPHILKEADKAWQWAVKKGRTYELDRKTYIVCDAFKRMWREAHPAITEMWDKLDHAMRAAIATPGRMFIVNQHLKVIREKAWLKIILPSGRALSYPSPRIEDGKITYMGLSTYSRQWKRLSTYGGKAFENIVQAGARDVFKGTDMRDGTTGDSTQQMIYDAGYEIKIPCHDELVTQTDDTDEYSVEGLCAFMARELEWAQGLPLAAAGFECRRYRKE